MNNAGKYIFVSLIAVALLLTACEREQDHDHNASHGSGDSHAGHDHESQSNSVNNAIDIGPSVRSNLGISFVKVERRRIEQTVRVPGRFEYEPRAMQDYRAMLPGRIHLLVDQFETVKQGDVLFRINSPAWREMQQQLAEKTSTIITLESKLRTFGPLLKAHERHEESLQQSIAVWVGLVEQLESVRQAGGGRMTQLAEARATLSSTRSELAQVQEKKAELEASREATIADRNAATVQLQLLLRTASSLVQLTADELKQSAKSGDSQQQRWQTLDLIEVRAETSGVVSDLNVTDGAWVEQKSPVLDIVQPNRLRFRASGLQSDLGVLKDGLNARIVPPSPTTSGRAVNLQDTMQGTVQLGLTGDPNDRTIDLYVTPESLSDWARPGVTAQLEVITDMTATPELAIPFAAVQEDGIKPVIFRRDPNNPNRAMRIDADLGKSDGRWVAVLSGLMDGDEVVLDGAFQLMLASSEGMQKGGHFHADGTFHEEDH